MQSLLDHWEQLEGWLSEHNHPAFRARQIRKWVLQNRATSFDDMTDLSKKLRDELVENFVVQSVSVARHQQSPDGTEKLLVKLSDGNHVECVLLRDGLRRTICVSSQVGCAMGCVFCASGLDGVERNLTSGEIIEQMLLLQALLPEEERLSHIVMMGMGEPLANLNNVLAALSVASSSSGLGISARRITISTVGLPPAIDRLAKLDCRFNLAISLHAPNDELRNKLVPVNDKVGIQALMDASDRYFATSAPPFDFRIRAARWLERLIRKCHAVGIGVERSLPIVECDSIQPGCWTALQNTFTGIRNELQGNPDGRWYRDKIPATKRRRYQCCLWPIAAGPNECDPAANGCWLGQH